MFTQLLDSMYGKILLQTGGVAGFQLASEGQVASSFRAAADTWAPFNFSAQTLVLKRQKVSRECLSEISILLCLCCFVPPSSHVHYVCVIEKCHL